MSREFAAEIEARTDEHRSKSIATRRRRGRRRSLVTIAEPVAGELLAGGADLGTVEAAAIIEVTGERLLEGDDLVNDTFADFILTAAQPVARLALMRNGHPANATGFMVSPNLLLTNEHVLRSADDAVDAFAEFDFRYEMTGSLRPAVRFQLVPDEFFWTSEELDAALVAVAAESSSSPRRDRSDFGYHRLIPKKAKIEVHDPITIIQHPAGDPRKVAVRENELLEYIDDVWMSYASDTARGSSGAPCFSDDFQVVALHSHGQPEMEGDKFVLTNGHLVDKLEGLDDSEVKWKANQGARASAIAAHISDGGLETATGAKKELLGRELIETFTGRGDIISRARAGEITVGERGTVSRPDLEAIERAVTIEQHTASADQPAFDGVVLQVPLRISIGDVVSPMHVAPVRADAMSSLDEVADDGTGFKFIDPNYRNRQGYDPMFLGVEVPLPQVDNDLLVRLHDSDTIPYEHFSVALSKERHMAVYVAGNVDYTLVARKHNKTREDMKEGAGAEKWYPDPRVDVRLQVPDVFYDDDRKAFDKGHLLRRDDVCWGSSFEEVKRANGDTFHLTNCSPQVLGFNRAPKGDHNWGDLEELVGSKKDRERYCVFSGPIYNDNDPIFYGTGGQGAQLAIKIPRTFWKVIVGLVEGELASWAFTLGQNLTGVKMEELVVDDAWQKVQKPIAELEERLWFRFPAVVRNAETMK